MELRRKTSGFLLVCGLLAILISLAMIVMGLLHAAPIDSQKMPDGVVRQNCTVIENCGQYIYIERELINIFNHSVSLNLKYNIYFLNMR
jgi:hypothetical protein